MLPANHQPLEQAQHVVSIGITRKAVWPVGQRLGPNPDSLNMIKLRIK